MFFALGRLSLRSPAGELWNVTSDPGAGGAAWTTENIGGAEVPLCKVAWGGAGAANMASAAAPLPVQDTPAAAGGTSGYHVVSAASNNAGVIKGSAGMVYGVDVNVDKAAGGQCCVKLYDKATTPAPGSDSALIKRTIIMQPGQSRYVPLGKGMVFASGIGIAIVRNTVDNDNTSTAANECSVDVDYK